MKNISTNEVKDAVLIGAGIVSATLGALLKEFNPDIKMAILEVRNTGAEESSSAWNNAGTGHAGLCELNYTPFIPGQQVNLKKAIFTNAQFEVSRSFWSHLVANGAFKTPTDFINPVPHMSFVQGEANVAFLKERYEKLKQHPGFDKMAFSDNPQQIQDWAPLVAKGRSAGEKMALTRVEGGTDISFGALTRKLLAHLEAQQNIDVGYCERVEDIKRVNDVWEIKSKNVITGEEKLIRSRFVFIGAGGAALLLLQKSGIPEGRGIGGFPVSGQWLRCDNPDIVEQHHAKVYGLSTEGLPTVVAPHLDTRIIDGKKSLLFGPYAGFTTKFLKKGSYFDVLSSIRLDNIESLVSVGIHNLDFIRYLIDQSTQTMEKRMAALHRFYPLAKEGDWKRQIAGQRVQIIKRDQYGRSILQMGTEVITSGDKSLAALLGASPGASVSVSVMLNLIEKCFPEQVKGAWAEKIKKIFPAREAELQTDATLYNKVHDFANKVLHLA
ncbi:L-2-hydroxyglutarate oxidase LhgO (LhgO) (PDB:3DME) [Commensalibacter communis]|uniref:malate dehydrogenase (quinone) n=1 Tax=Commensalibacter communis TaxID=2972786 RepID=UPI0022FF8935|nr:malate dehydrogenase (quinone) [Commensalibacter communis]CAI3927158.1 L-2-hydroxyglutarate oxidase LhgO (LhgO) (PDB:3DME) [Commensalibacter communis]CAI3931369.1 L-2-hydroxyglutarate oxidase LhgO (LhgO) (PDB:3DME) [Commensalibacter communis]CAI3932009.1 L-2-hydroxyglutarate oxidase LhgO (LhgO) (PDB:3DME) [Commensalibacter communis]